MENHQYTGSPSLFGLMYLWKVRFENRKFLYDLNSVPQATGVAFAKKQFQQMAGVPTLLAESVQTTLAITENCPFLR